MNLLSLSLEPLSSPPACALCSPYVEHSAQEIFKCGLMQVIGQRARYLDIPLKLAQFTLRTPSADASRETYLISSKPFDLNKETDLILSHLEWLCKVIAPTQRLPQMHFGVVLLTTVLCLFAVLPKCTHAVCPPLLSTQCPGEIVNWRRFEIPNFLF